MLVSVLFDLDNPNAEFSMFLQTALGRKAESVEIEKGVYLEGGFNFDHKLAVDLNMDQKYPSLEDKDGNHFGEYGVCDDYSQILELCPMLRNSERTFAIALVLIKKSEEPEEGGWRWHKWGSYIGTQDPVCEYIYNEPVIEQVYCYHIYEIPENGIDKS